MNKTSDFGLSALIRLGAALESEFTTAEDVFSAIEVMSIEPLKEPVMSTSPLKEPVSQFDFTMELAGRHLSYAVHIYGERLFLFAGPIDSPDRLTLVLRDYNHPTGFITVRNLIRALEQNEIKALDPKPVEIGIPGTPNSWVIG